MINHTKSRRIYRELDLQLRSKTTKRRVKAKKRDDRKEAARAHETWAMDFVHDQLATGPKLGIRIVVDLFSRFSPVIDPRFRYRGEDVVAKLERVCAVMTILARSGSIRVRSSSRVTSICEPIKTTSRSTSAGPESRRKMRLSKRSMARLHAEYLSTRWFQTLEDATKKLKNWRRHYYEVSPRTLPGMKPPITSIDRPVPASPTGPLNAKFSGFG